MPAPTSVALSRPALLDVSGYRIERSVPAGSGPWTAVGSVGELAFIDTGLDPETPVQYRVSAQYADGRLGVSQPVSVQTTKPVNPANLRGSVATHVINAQITPTFNASSVAYGDITLTWDPVPGAGSYEIARQRPSHCPVGHCHQLRDFASYRQGLAQYQVIAYFMPTASAGSATWRTQRLLLEVVVGSPPVGGFGGRHLRR